MEEYGHPFELFDSGKSSIGVLPPIPLPIVTLISHQSRCITLISKYLRRLCFQCSDIVVQLEQIHVLQMVPYEIEGLVNVSIDDDE